MTETNPLIEGLLRIHKIISRGLNISLQKCEEYLGRQGIPPEEIAGFSMYVKALKWVTHAHHLSEDEIAFPYFRNKIEAPFERLQDDHRIISSVLVRLDQCLAEIPSDDIIKLRELLGEFEKLWVPHIKIEEENFTPEKLQKIAVASEQVKIAANIAIHSSKNSGPGPLSLPFLFYNLEGKDREILLLSFPWIVKKVLVPIIWRGQWKPMSPFLL